MPFFAKNIDPNGRVIRAIAAITLIAAALLTWPQSRAIGVTLALSAAFVGFEAARGWCALRACGVKTKF